MENIRILSLFEYRISKYPNTLCVFFQSPNIRFLSIMRQNQNTYRSAKKSEWPTLFKIHKYFLPVRILGRLTVSAEATSVPLSSLSVLLSPLAGWIVRDKGEQCSLSILLINFKDQVHHNSQNLPCVPCLFAAQSKCWLEE